VKLRNAFLPCHSFELTDVLADDPKLGVRKF
jgi:hypothetical protein